MKVLVYGAGVIGSYLVHALCQAGNEVSLLARGARKTTLEQNGLVLHHYLQKITTTDHPHIVEQAGGQAYDAVFAVMQYQQMGTILADLAQADTPLVVLVGNNLSAPAMEREILAQSPKPKTVLFGFQSTAGNRENGYVECVRLGGGELYLGGLHREATRAEKAKIVRLFHGAELKVKAQDDMDGWYKSHLAFILPVAYLCYGLGCDLHGSTKAQRKQLLDATAEGYELLKRLHVAIRPVGEDSYYDPGIKRVLCVLIVYGMAKTKLGELCASDHCRHAVAEMESLDEAWGKLRQQAPDLPMPNWDALQAAMPSWEELYRIYNKT